MASQTTDPEKALFSTTHTVPSSLDRNNDQFRSNQAPLELFQQLVGIHTPASLQRKGSSGNSGLYQRARTEARTARIRYTLTSLISNSLYMLQIILAATFTALSAYKDSNVATLTVLGALNTVLAGCLAWQKGQGVPQRYRKAADGYEALVLEIEMAERSFLDCTRTSEIPDPRAEKARLQKLFDIARADEVANVPDLYVSTGGKDTRELEKQVKDAKAETVRVQEEMMAKIEALMGRLEGKVDGEGL